MSDDHEYRYVTSPEIVTRLRTVVLTRADLEKPLVRLLEGAANRIETLEDDAVYVVNRLHDEIDALKATVVPCKGTDNGACCAARRKKR